MIPSLTAKSSEQPTFPKRGHMKAHGTKPTKTEAVSQPCELHSLKKLQTL